MPKRSNSATEDATDKSEDTETFFSPNRYDIIPIVLAVIVFVLGLTAALLSYFLLHNNEVADARNDLRLSTAKVQVELTNAFAEVTAVVVSTAAFFQVSKTEITLYDQFAPYVMSAGYFPKYLTSLAYTTYVPYEQTASFAAKMQATGLAEYSNFTVTGRDANNNVVAPIYTPIRCVITQVVPTAFMAISSGYDMCTDAEKNATFIRAVATGKVTASGAIISAYNSVVSLSAYQAVYNKTDNTTLGALGGLILMTDLIEQSLSSVLDGYQVALYDMNSTSTDNFMYTTASDANTTITSKQIATLIAEAPYWFDALVPFADRFIKIVVIPDKNYEDQFNYSTKFIALTVSLVIMGVLLVGCVIIFFTRKLIIAKRKRGEAHIQIDLLKTNQVALRTLLDRIATQEAKTRAVINSLVDCVCVISSAGKILQTNASFDDEFPFSQQEMEKGVYTWDIFTELASDFFRVMDETAEVSTHAQRRFGDVLEVSIRVRDLRGKEGETSSQSNDKKESNTNIPLLDLEEAYVIIIKNSSLKIVSEMTTQERIKRHEFERKLRDKEFRDDLKRWCEKNQNAENLLFLEQVKEYKKSAFSVRVDAKEAIFNRFIAPNAPMQLNLSNEVVTEESLKISKVLGDLDCFKNVEEIVLKILASDIYPRYVLDQRKNSIE